MKEIILDGSKFTDIQITHEILKDTFEFPDYYGKNLDAFWDCITEHAIDCLHEGNEKIVWKDFNVSKKHLGEKADILLQLFQEANEKYGGFTIEVIP